MEHLLTWLAGQALYAELITYPKPGLVSLVDNGSHTDMDHTTFIYSINALSGYFAQMAKAGINQEVFIVLNQFGKQAELKMLDATHGVNTHRGAIFILGLLVAAAASTNNYASIPANLINLWGNDLLLHQTNYASHGATARSQYKLRNDIVTEAATGFPMIFGLVGKYEKLCNNYGIEYARIITFLSIMHKLDDTNLVHRGGIEGLNYAQSRAGEILLVYAQNKSSVYNQTLLLHQQFIQRNLSPGGCADVLAAVIFLSEVKRLYHADWSA